MVKYFCALALLVASFSAHSQINLTFPTSGSFTGSTDTVSWDPVPNATSYWVDVGSRGDRNQYFNQQTSGLSLQVLGLPIDGSDVYVDLWYRVNSVWTSQLYIITAATSDGGNGGGNGDGGSGDGGSSDGGSSDGGGSSSSGSITTLLNETEVFAGNAASPNGVAYSCSTGALINSTCNITYNTDDPSLVTVPVVTHDASGGFCQDALANNQPASFVPRFEIYKTCLVISD